MSDRNPDVVDQIASLRDEIRALRLERATAGVASPTAYLHRGAGSPEGVLVAPVGDVYQQTDGTQGATFWVKESGAASTGWVIVSGNVPHGDVAESVTASFGTPSTRSSASYGDVPGSSCAIPTFAKYRDDTVLIVRVTLTCKAAAALTCKFGVQIGATTYDMSAPSMVIGDTVRHGFAFTKRFTGIAAGAYAIKVQVASDGTNNLGFHQNADVVQIEVWERATARSVLSVVLTAPTGAWSARALSPATGVFGAQSVNLAAAPTTWSARTLAPTTSGPVVAEPFTHADGALGNDGVQPWTDLVAGLLIDSNALYVPADYTHEDSARCETTLGTTDHEVGLHVTSFTAQPNEFTLLGVTARFAAAADSGYVFYFGCYADNTWQVAIAERTAGVLTDLVTDTWALPPLPFDVTIRVEGTSIGAYVNGVQVLSTTDSTHTTGTRGGLWAYSTHGANNMRADDWFGQAASAANPPGSVNLTPANAVWAARPLAIAGTDAIPFGGGAWLDPLPATKVIDPDSATIVAALAGVGNRVLLSDQYSLPVYRNTAGATLYTVIVDTETLWGWYDLTPVQVPLPAGIAPNPGSDGKVVVDDGTWVYDMAHFEWVGSVPHCAYSGLYLRSGDGRGEPANYWPDIRNEDDVLVTYSPPVQWNSGTRISRGTGSGISSYAGCITLTDVVIGEIRHTLTAASSLVIGPPIGYPDGEYSNSQDYRYPATATDHANGVVFEGMRLWLDMTAGELAAISNPAQRMVAIALRDYGVVITDGGGALLGFNRELPKPGDSDPWPGLGADMGYFNLDQIPWGKLKVLRRWDGT